jgi:hypothetical protein
MHSILAYSILAQIHLGPPGGLMFALPYVLSHRSRGRRKSGFQG